MTYQPIIELAGSRATGKLEISSNVSSTAGGCTQAASVVDVAKDYYETVRSPYLTIAAVGSYGGWVRLNQDFDTAVKLTASFGAVVSTGLALASAISSQDVVGHPAIRKL